MGISPAPSGDIQGVTLEELKRIRGEELKPVSSETRIVFPRTTSEGARMNTLTT